MDFNRTKMMDRDKFELLLKNLVLSLCQERYQGDSNGIEVDAIICISKAFGRHDEQVIKIHQKILDDESFLQPNEDQQICTLANVWSSKVPKTRKTAEQNTENRSHTLELMINKQKRIPVAKENSQQSFSVSTQAETKTKKAPARKKRKPNNEKVENLPSKGETSKQNEGNSSKFPCLLQTLCGDGGMFLSSTNVISKENQQPDNSNASNDVTSQQSKSRDSTVASLLSNLVIPSSIVTNGNASSTPPVEIVKSNNKQVPENVEEHSNENIEQSSMDSCDENEAVNWTNVPEDGASKENAAVSCSNDPEEGTTVEGEVPTSSCDFFIKQEPEWEATNYGQAVPTDQDSNDKGDNCNSTANREESDGQQLLLAGTQTEEIDMSEVRVKDEPLDEDSGELSNYGNESETGNSNDNSQTEKGGGKGSILMNILKGKSLKEAYNSGGQDEQGQKNSLLYRLPFTSFQDLFPGSTSSASSGNTDSPVTMKTEPDGTVTPTRYEPTPSSSSKSERYSTRKRRTTDYSEVYESDFEITDEDSDTVTSDNDSTYTPHIKTKNSESELKVRTGKPNRARRGGGRGNFRGNVKKVGYISEVGNRGKGLLKSPETTSTASTSTNTSSYIDYTDERYNNPKNTHMFLFSCSICGSEFATREARDKHEEAEQYQEFVKCPLCNGYFGDENSKRKHMKERHKIHVSTDNKSFKVYTPQDDSMTGRMTLHSTQCPVCYTFFEEEKDRNEHMLSEHNIVPIKHGEFF